MVREVFADVMRKPRALGYKEGAGSAGKSTPWIITNGATGTARRGGSRFQSIMTRARSLPIFILISEEREVGSI